MDIEAKGISHLANTYLIASKRCQEIRQLDNGKIEMPLIPAIVCMAFSVELYFKSILKAEGKNIKVHKLDSLYEQISETTKKMIVAQTKLPDEKFKNKLSDVTNAFVEWRYIFELESKSEDISFLRLLANAVSKISIDLTK